MMMDPSLWDKEPPVPLSAITYVDNGILKKLPPSIKVVEISPSGSSYWARTAKIEAINSDGKRCNFFLKVHQGQYGLAMITSEYKAMNLMYRTMPELFAKPIAYGSYDMHPDTHFFLCEYYAMSADNPDVKEFPALVAELHKRGVAPDGRFGYPYETFGGNKPQMFAVTDTWEACFTQGMKNTFAAELQTQGHDEELKYLIKMTLEKTIPRLLRPLETEGRSITPRLVHGDMWEGNLDVDLTTGKPIVFDATPLYAHNEYELGPWLPPRLAKTRPYIHEYTKHFTISEPVEEFDDRVELYCLRFDMHSSALYKGVLWFREIGKETMTRLLDKYGEGYEGYANRNRTGSQSPRGPLESWVEDM